MPFMFLIGRHVSCDTCLFGVAIVCLITVASTSAVVPSAHARRQLPRVVLQYGVPRTATTLQTYIVQTCLKILKPNAKVFGAYLSSPKFPRRLPLSPSNTTHYVFKTHSIHLLSALRRADAWPKAWQQALRQAPLFVTAKGNQDSWQGQAQELEAKTGRDIWYAQLTAELARGPSIVYDYGMVLGMDSSQTSMLYDNIRPWSTLRQCCGTQMSQAWRHILTGGKHTSRGHSNPACERHDLDAVQKAYEAVSVLPHFSLELSDNPCGQCRNSGGLQLRLNCTRYNAWVAKEKAKFNQRAPCSVCDAERRRGR